MMITAVYFQARPGVVFSVLLGPAACVPRTGTRVKIWGRGTWPCTLADWSDKNSGSAARPVRQELGAAAVLGGGVQVRLRSKSESWWSDSTFAK